MITCPKVFTVWPKTTLLLPEWPRDATRLDTPGRCLLKLLAHERPVPCPALRSTLSMCHLRVSQQHWNGSVFVSISWMRKPELGEVSSLVPSPMTAELDLKLGRPGLTGRRPSPWPSDGSSLGLPWRPQDTAFPRFAHKAEERVP